MTLAEAVQVIREEITIAQENGRTEDLQFEVGPVEVEFTVVASRSGKAKAGLTFLVPIGVEGGIGREDTHRVTVTLTPVLRTTGKSPRVSDRASGLPDH
ncbi:trypco2 family protein [Plantactinospora soyae]|uniref:Trypsin-co-occurring domain-containing protein n=1 Tax=Plantactinospora soyae TaxID=1544732 RepID=A0A927R4B5_9ACTN|nr:trypco2 family protein [Plantactinospora soyae]MBE1484846.1 hypothetical protein [Plantactinospora soyae]